MGRFPVGATSATMWPTPSPPHNPICQRPYSTTITPQTSRSPNSTPHRFINAPHRNQIVSTNPNNPHLIYSTPPPLAKRLPSTQRAPCLANGLPQHSPGHRPGSRNAHNPIGQRPYSTIITPQTFRLSVPVRLERTFPAAGMQFWNAMIPSVHPPSSLRSPTSNVASPHGTISCWGDFRDDVAHAQPPRRSNWCRRHNLDN
jgi:hypothetical protein